MAEQNDILGNIANIINPLAPALGAVSGAQEVMGSTPNYNIMDILGGAASGAFQSSALPSFYNVITQPVGNTPDRPSLSEMQQAVAPTFQSIQTGQNIIESARDSFPQEPVVPTPPIYQGPSIDDLISSIQGPSAQQLQLASAQEYQKLVNEASKNMANTNAAILSKYAPKIRKGLTKAEKAALDAEINANKRRYESALKDAQGAYNFANRNIRQIGEQSSALNAALIPAAQQQLADAVGGSARIAAESGLAGVGGGVASAGMSDAAKAAAMNARQAIGSILGTEGAGIESSPAMAALLAGAPPLEFFNQTIDPRQFGALQSGRLGTDIASQALAAGQASDVTNIARLAADREAGMRERALAASLARQQQELDEFNRLAMQSELNTAAQINANRLSAAERISNALAQDPRTPAEIAKQQLDLNEAGILLQQKYNPAVSEDPDIGTVYEAGLQNPLANRLSTLISSTADTNGNIVLNEDPTNPNNNLLVSSAALEDLVITTVGQLSTLPENRRKSYVNSELINLRKTSPEAYQALALALTGNRNAKISNVSSLMLGQSK